LDVPPEAAVYQPFNVYVVILVEVKLFVEQVPPFALKVTVRVSEVAFFVAFGNVIEE
jgi:hypothetical protein